MRTHSSSLIKKILDWVKKYQDDIILVIGAALISLLSFAMGYIVASQEEKEPIKIERRDANLRMTSEFMNGYSYIRINS